VRGRGLGRQGNRDNGKGRCRVGQRIDEANGKNRRMEKRKIALGGPREEGLRQVGVGCATTMVLMLRRFDTAKRIRVGLGGGHVGQLRRCVDVVLATVIVAMIQGRMRLVGMGNTMGGMLKQCRVVHGEMHLCANAQPERKEVAYEKATQFHFGSIYRAQVPWQEGSHIS